MNKEKRHILIVDDSPNDIHFLMESLKHDYAVLVATDGQKGFEIANGKHRPDVILMDVVMPEMDGYEACRKIKENPKTQDIDVIFVSAHDTIEEKLAGYNAGGSDYLIKPVEPSELLRKVKLAIDNKHLKDSISAEKNVAFDTAMTAMTSAGEQSVALHFIRNSISIKSYPSLAQELLQFLGSLSLSVSLALWNDKETTFYNSGGTIVPIEAEILEVAREKNDKKISTFGQHCLILGSQSTLLVHNLPDDAEKSGRFKELLTMMIDSVDQLSNQIFLKSQLIKSEMQMTQAMLLTSQTISTLKQRTIKSRKKIKKASDELVANMEDKFLTLGLTEDQEDELISMILDTEGLIDKEISASLGLEKEMEKILEINRELRWKTSDH